MKDNLVLNGVERAEYALRALYRSYGFTQYKMSKFEEYDLYAKNKDFLVSDNVITFTDTDGKLLALKPDVTLSIIKNSKDDLFGVQKVFYNENVYRVSKGTRSFKELMQVGLECIGDIDEKEVCEVLSLAVKSLKTLSNEFVLDISHLGVINAVMDYAGLSVAGRKEFLEFLSQKNAQGVSMVCQKENLLGESKEILEKLVNLYGNPEQVLDNLNSIDIESVKDGVKQLNSIVLLLKKQGFEGKINIDFSVVSDINYYNGVVFKGFVSGIPASILSGGCYDNLMQKMARKSKAIGFAVYLDELEKLCDTDRDLDSDISSMKEENKSTLNVALPKGRLGEKVYAMFEKAGFPCPSIKESNRKLIFENQEVGVRYFWVKPSDVAIYVERGAADIGVAGKDILLEYRPEVYELLDLNMGKCDMAVASKKDFADDRTRTLTVATKFTNIAKEYYAKQGRDIDIIHLNGSIEIAPILGLSDVIVDIVETGATLKENDLVVVEKFLPISARLIANKANFKFKSKKIQKIMTSLEKETVKL